MLRRGLPRVPGGEPWPPGDVTVEVDESDAGSGAAAAAAGPEDGASAAARDAALFSEAPVLAGAAESEETADPTGITESAEDAAAPGPVVTA